MLLFFYYYYLKLILDALAKVKSLNKPVIVRLSRTYDYQDWVDLVTKDGNEEDAKALCEFASRSNIDGFLLSGIAPRVNFILFY